jgi:hypothetical protein
MESWLRLRVSIQSLPWDGPFSANRPVTLSEICIGGNKWPRHFSCWDVGERSMREYEVVILSVQGRAKLRDRSHGVEIAREQNKPHPRVGE